MEEKVLIRSTRSNKVLYALNAIIFVLYLLFCMIMYASNDGWTTFGDWFLDYIVILIALLVTLNLSLFKSTMVVTDKRIYGITYFGKRVDLPLDSVSAIAVKYHHVVSASSSSGKISFALIENANDIHKCISDLLIQRQTQKKTLATQNESNADELKKYKELLDSGVISQEEFDAKKKQLLDL